MLCLSHLRSHLFLFIALDDIEQFLIVLSLAHGRLGATDLNVDGTRVIVLFLLVSGYHRWSHVRVSLVFVASHEISHATSP